MELQLSLKGERNLIRQIYEQMRLAILDGRLKAGDRLPSTRELAKQLEVARKTVSLAYDLLFGEGIIAGRPGSGTFVSENIPSPKVERSKLRPFSPIRPKSIWQNLATRPAWLTTPARYHFRVGLPEISAFPFAIWKSLLSRGAQFSAPEGELDFPGLEEARGAIAKYVGFTRAVRCAPGDVIITNGAQQAFDLIGRVLIRSGDIVAVEEPGYPPVRQVFESQGARVVGIPVDDQGIVIERIPEQAKLIYVTPSHQFPLGIAMSLSRRIALIEWAATHGTAIIEDDYDSEFRFEGRSLESLQNLDHHGVVLYVGTFSKILFPAIRLGFMVAPKPVRSALVAAKRLTDGPSSPVNQAALAEFIREGHLARHVRRMRHLYSDRRRVVLEGLEKYLSDWLVPVSSSAGLHVSAYLAPGFDDNLVRRKAEQSDVGVDPLSFYFQSSPARKGLVLGYGATASEDLREGLLRLSKILAKLR